ncbi:MAG: sialate O-acetylesterase [Emticicia sp.]|nr:sialate O-acetylesterase [Emticicia sp.]
MSSMAVFSQVHISEFPANNQVIQRNEQDEATFQVKGRVDEGGHSSIALKVLQDGNTFFEQSANASSDFTFSPTLKAGKFDYTFILTLDGSREIKKTTQVGVGDLFLVYGQSNALGSGGIDTYRPPRNALIRFFTVANFENGDNEWVLPYQTSTWPGTGASELLNFLCEKYNYPVGVIMASVGGADITALNNRNSQNPADLNTYYGKLLSQAILSNSKENLRYIIFKQGESDALMPLESQRYQVEFTKFYNNLLLDFPSLKKIYNLQIDILTDPNNKAGVLRDFQRRTSRLFPNVTAMSTVGTTGYDGLHYSLEGYRQVAYELSRIIGKEVYDDFQSKQIYSPDIRYIYKTNSKLILEFDEGMEMIYPNDTTINGKLWRMNDFIFINGQNNLVVSGEANANKIILSLLDGVEPLNVSYLPNNYGTFGTDYYNGRHLKNGYGMRAFSFDNVLVEAAPTPINLSFNILNDAKVSLSWNIEGNFSLERSIDNVNFTFITNVNGYEYIDNTSEVEQKYFYRLISDENSRNTSNTVEVSLKCVNNYNFSIVPLITNFIGVNLTIISTAKIPQTKQLSLEANRSINLEPGFDAELGSTFSAEIGGCKNN